MNEEINYSLHCFDYKFFDFNNIKLIKCWLGLWLRTNNIHWYESCCLLINDDHGMFKFKILFSVWSKWSALKDKVSEKQCNFTFISRFFNIGVKPLPKLKNKRLKMWVNIGGVIRFAFIQFNMYDNGCFHKFCVNSLFNSQF